MNIFNNLSVPTISDILNFAEKESVTGNIYREFIISQIIKSENLLSYVCERMDKITDLDYSLTEICLDDIKEIHNKFFEKNQFQDILKNYKTTLKNTVFDEYKQALTSIMSSYTPTEMLKNLIAFYFQFGGGEKSRYISYKWKNALLGIKNPDTITYANLFNIEPQKSTIQKNTQNFISGQKANNILLAGDSGTGKSSLVKATLNEFYTKKLRIIEVEKQEIRQIPEIFNAVRGTGFKYIIFIDDLSFEENEPEYKELKSILDGKTEKQPDNVLFYATSNRRHIIKESWDDRSGSDIHVNDTKNETMSLSERFGIHISFFSLSKQEYLHCVKSKCEALSIEYDEDAALKFAIRHNGFSGRTAEQFTLRG